MNTYFIVSTQIVAILVALCVNEIRHKFFKRVTQSLVFLPYFLSWVVVSGIIFNMLDLDQGTINQFLSSIGLERIRWYQSPQYWRAILTLANGWKFVGYTSVIYLASLSALVSSINCSIVMVSTDGFWVSNDTPVPRCSQLATIK
jgi:ABC-type polysaccharide transport system permease subunit